MEVGDWKLEIGDWKLEIGCFLLGAARLGSSWFVASG